MRSLLLFPLLLPFIYADFKPKQYTINLDSAPDQRWNQVIQDHLSSIPAVAEESKAYIPKVFQPFVWWVASKVATLFPKEYYQELQGIARESGLPLGEVVGLNILYDITAFNRKHILSGLGCTSIVAEDTEGRIIHGRNLDYEMGDLLKNITVILDFTKGGKVLYSGVSFALYNGLLTGQRPGAFTVSLNARYSGAYIDNILMELYTKFKRPVSYFLREVLESAPTYEDALIQLTSIPLISPSYIILGGLTKGQGAVISRNRLKALDVYTLDSLKGRWFIVETNFDHWKGDEDGRRIKAETLLNKFGHVDLKVMDHVLHSSPVRNNLTIYSVVMSASHPLSLKKSMIVVD